jgi:deoxyadenosine/deoxycytidine kinase
VEYEILDDYFNMLTSNEACKLDLISMNDIDYLIFYILIILVYLRATPKTCIERIRARNRPEETTIDLGYLTTLHRRHEEWLMPRADRDTLSPPVIIVDANQNKERVYTDTNNHVINLISC